MKVSINQQIDEIERELKQRGNVYARIAASSPSEKSKLEFQTARLEAARATLVWLRDNELLIKQRLSY